MLEKDLQKQILEHLNLSGHFCWRNNTGAFKNPKGDFYRFGVVGSPDILGVSKNGKMIAVEVKIKPNKPTIYQQNFLDQVKSRGGYAICAYSLEDVSELLTTLL